MPEPIRTSEVAKTPPKKPRREATNTTIGPVNFTPSEAQLDYLRRSAFDYCVDENEVNAIMSMITGK